MTQQRWGLPGLRVAVVENAPGSTLAGVENQPASALHLERFTDVQVTQDQLSSAHVLVVSDTVDLAKAREFARSLQLPLAIAGRRPTRPPPPGSLIEGSFPTLSPKLLITWWAGIAGARIIVIDDQAGCLPLDEPPRVVATGGSTWVVPLLIRQVDGPHFGQFRNQVALLAKDAHVLIDIKLDADDDALGLSLAAELLLRGAACVSPVTGFPDQPVFHRGLPALDWAVPGRLTQPLGKDPSVTWAAYLASCLREKPIPPPPSPSASSPSSVTVRPSSKGEAQAALFSIIAKAPWRLDGLASDGTFAFSHHEDAISPTETEIMRIGEFYPTEAPSDYLKTWTPQILGPISASARGKGPWEQLPKGPSINVGTPSCLRDVMMQVIAESDGAGCPVSSPHASALVEWLTERVCPKHPKSGGVLSNLNDATKGAST